MGESHSSLREYLMDDFRERFYSPPLIIPSFALLCDSFIVGTDPIDPISPPKSEGDDLVLKTTPKYYL